MTSLFKDKQKQFFAGNILKKDIVKKYAMPLTQWQPFNTALKNNGHFIFYAVNACNNLVILLTMPKTRWRFAIVLHGILEKIVAMKDAQAIIFLCLTTLEKQIKKYYLYRLLVT